MAIAIAIVLLVIGTVAFHILNPWWFTPIASNWGEMDDTVNLTFWVCGAVFVAVNLFMAYAIVRYRHRKGQERRAEYEPEYKKLEWWLIGLTSVGVIAMLAPGLVVWAKFVTVPDDAKVVEALGQQWSWTFRLPGRDGALGAIDAALIGPDNPFGMDANDPRGQDDVLVSGQELHLPIDQPVKVLLRSKDVLHDFTVPQFRVKMDLVPGMITYLWLTPTKVGVIRNPLRRAVRHGSLRHARPRRRRRRRRLRAVAGRATDIRADLARPAADAVAGQARVRGVHRVSRRDGRRQPGTECAKTRGSVGLVPRTPAAEFQARFSRRRPRRCDRQPDGRDGRATG